MKPFACVTLATVLLSLGAALARQADAEEVVADVPMPEVIFSGLANPFPALYYFAADGRLLAKGIGKDSAVFTDIGAVLKTPPLQPAASIEAQQREFLFKQINKAAARRARIFFVTIHPNMGHSQTCVQLLAKVRQAIADARPAAQIELIVLQAAG